MTLLIVALPFLWDRKSSSFLFSEHIFNPWNIFFLLNAICLTAYKIESFAIGIPKQINTNIEACHGKIQLMKMILCNFQELFHLCLDTMNEQLLPCRQWSVIVLIKTKTSQIRDFHSCWATQTTEMFIISDPYNSIEKKKCDPFAVVLFTRISLCLYEFASVRQKRAFSDFHAN